jgi:hypothetical protein
MKHQDSKLVAEGGDAREGHLLQGGAQLGKPYKVRTAKMGARPSVNLDKALQLAGELEDEEILRKMALRK